MRDRTATLHQMASLVGVAMETFYEHVSTKKSIIFIKTGYFGYLQFFMAVFEGQ